MGNPSLMQPISWDGEVSPQTVGMRREGVAAIVRIFERFLAEDWHPGAQLVVLRYGQPVVDRAAGWADVARRKPVTADTPFLTYSVTKAFTGACIHALVEQGRVELDAPVGRYWPEFACKGKEKATLRHTLLHQAGIPLRGLNGEALLSWNWNLVERYVAGLAAEFEPGTKCAYHLVNYGFILGGVIHRVSGLRPDVFMRRTLFEPLGLVNSSLGLPPSNARRAARVYCGHPSQRRAVMMFDRVGLRRAVIPAASLNTTARDMAVFYQMLLNEGKYAGRQVLRAETVLAATSLGFEGPDEFLDFPIRWAHGFQLGGRISADPKEVVAFGKGSSLRTFGHNGQASCMAWADFDAGVVATFTCNRLLDSERVLARWVQLSDAVWDALN